MKNYFYYTARPKSINPIYFIRLIREGYSVQLIRIKYPDLYKELCGLIAKSGSTGCEWSDYLTLYQEIRLRRPLRILELGSGISSLVICYAIEKNLEEIDASVKFFSIDENEFYHNQIVKIFPAKYQDRVNFLLCNRVQKRYKNILGSYYENLPDEDFDFIFIDGPTTRTEESLEKSFNADLVNLIESNKLSQVNGLLDERIFSKWMLKKLIPKLRIKYSWIRKMSFFAFYKD